MTGRKEDQRFTKVIHDPKFRRLGKKDSKLKIDPRFQSMFTDPKFTTTYTVDKRGRPIKYSTNEKLKRFYDLDDEDEDDEDEEEDEDESGKEEDEHISDEDDEDEKEDMHKSDEDEDERQRRARIKNKLKNMNIDYARGEGELSDTSSSDDDETSEEENEMDKMDHKWGELDAEATAIEDATRRLAACNLDWDRIRCTDLMVLFNSFVPTTGKIESVEIFTSEFGKKRLAEEEVRGPCELTTQEEDVRGGDEENELGATFHNEKLRQYQLNRLKYYYAVITCDSVETANQIYADCDGREYESSATKLDLRFIPDDMEFDDEPKDRCDHLPEKYEPVTAFITTALQQGKVRLTWDETDVNRKEFTKKLTDGKKIDGISDADLHQFLASSSGEDDDDEEEHSNSDQDEGNDNVNPIDKYKSLLQDIEDKEQKKANKDVGLEISWGMQLQHKTDQLLKKKIEKDTKTPFQELLDRRKEKRKEKREKRKQDAEAAENKNSNNSDSESDDEIPDGIDMSDKYFAEEFDNAEFKQTKSKSKSKLKKDSDDDEEQKQNKTRLELLLADDDDHKHFSLKKIQDNEDMSKSKLKRLKKKKHRGDDSDDDEVVKQVEDKFEINVDDARFSALYTSHHFNIDPTDSHYKKTKGMERLIEEKLKRRNNAEEALKESVLAEKRPKKSAELSVLVKSIKRNAESFKTKKKKHKIN